MKALFNKKQLIIIGFVVVLTGVGLILALSFGGGSNLLEDEEPLTRINAQSATGDEQITVYRDGRVEITKSGQTYTEFWSKGKVDAFFEYYNSTYGSEDSVTYENDELISAIINDATGSSGSSSGSTGGNNQGGNIGNFFNTPTPGPGGGQGGGNTPAPTPDDPSDQPWCLYWRLSYCVIKYVPPATGGPTATPGPNILPPNCPENKITGRTVIGNELCFTSPTPSPTP